MEVPDWLLVLRNAIFSDIRIEIEEIHWATHSSKLKGVYKIIARQC